MKYLLYGGLGGGVGILGIIFAGALYVVESVRRPKKRGIFDDYTYSPYELDLPAEAVTFPPLHGEYQVSGWFIPHPQATTTILVCPGYRTPKSDLLGISAHLWKAGHNVLIFDYYGHGTPIGTPLTLGYSEVNDFFGAIDYAKRRAPQTRFGVVAYSMGAAIAIMCSARNTDIEALVLDSPFATHWSVIDYNVRRTFHLPSAPFVWTADYLMWWRARYRFHQVEPLREIAKISPRPILLIHGGKDSLVDPHDATLLYNAAGEPKELWFLPEADHCGAYFVDRIAYTKKVLNFFEQNLKKLRLQLVEQTNDKPFATDSPDQNLSEAS
ncbi:MAG TPA: alpha/beta hydrolase [Ktedonobacteraceae bacterium]|nr:alpha/beta hydrolase [Ktedonobacteraceae bacterium]